MYVKASLRGEGPPYQAPVYYQDPAAGIDSSLAIVVSKRTTAP